MVPPTNIHADCAAADVQSQHITSCSSIYANDTNQSSFAHSKVSDAPDVVADSLRLAYEGLGSVGENNIDPPFVAWRRKPVTQKEPCDETRTFPMLRLIRAKAYHGA
ncbi:hypothetical protein Tco_0979609 [Tanacetum coccineum]